jgi:hypothetical protein
MVGLKVGKLHGWPPGRQRLDAIMGPAALSLLGENWWICDARHYALPVEWLIADAEEVHASQTGAQPAPRDPRQASFDRAFVAHRGDLAIARPGFVPDFADLISGDWTVLYGTSANPADDPSLFSALSTLDPFFCTVSQLPTKVSAVIRGIDWAYWEVAADEVVIQNVEWHLRGAKGIYIERAFGHDKAISPNHTT